MVDMCGFSGFIQYNIDSIDYTKILDLMSLKLIERGPNSSGKWFSKKDGVALCHRRLSIIDLTNSGHQPMESYNGRYIITYKWFTNFPNLTQLI